MTFFMVKTILIMRYARLFEKLALYKVTPLNSDKPLSYLVMAI